MSNQYLVSQSKFMNFLLRDVLSQSDLDPAVDALIPTIIKSVNMGSNSVPFSMVDPDDVASLLCSINGTDSFSQERLMGFIMDHQLSVDLLDGAFKTYFDEQGPINDWEFDKVFSFLERKLVHGRCCGWWVNNYRGDYIKFNKSIHPLSFDSYKTDLKELGFAYDSSAQVFKHKARFGLDVTYDGGVLSLMIPLKTIEGKGLSQYFI